MKMKNMGAPQGKYLGRPRAPPSPQEGQPVPRSRRGSLLCPVVLLCLDGGTKKKAHLAQMPTALIQACET